MAQVNLDNALEDGREAVHRHAWREAFELLTAADQAVGLSPEDLEALAYAAWWSGHAQACISARERPSPPHVEASHPRQAALLAVALAKGQFEQRASAVGKAWLSRAERLLRDEPIGVEHGHLSRLQAVVALDLHDQGRALVGRGQVGEGMVLFDEAAVAALSGELQPMTTGIIYCNLIDTCEGRADNKRPAEWPQ